MRTRRWFMDMEPLFLDWWSPVGLCHRGKDNESSAVSVGVVVFWKSMVSLLPSVVLSSRCETFRRPFH